MKNINLIEALNSEIEDAKMAVLATMWSAQSAESEGKVLLQDAEFMAQNDDTLDLLEELLLQAVCMTKDVDLEDEEAVREEMQEFAPKFARKLLKDADQNEDEATFYLADAYRQMAKSAYFLAGSNVYAQICLR